MYYNSLRSFHCKTHLFWIIPLLILTLPVSLRAASVTVIIDGLKYSVDTTAKTAQVYADTSKKPTGDLAIPESITYSDAEYPVTSLKFSAFSNCTGLTSIVVPNSVTVLGYSAFNGCSSVTSITIPASITAIERTTFLNCSGLTEITIPENVTSIGNQAFYNCSKLKKIVVPDKVTTLGSSVFEGCTDLTEIQLPASLTNIGDYDFAGTSITEITIPESVETIGKGAFSGCANLSEVIIGSNVKSIGSDAFKGCDKLSTIFYPDALSDLTLPEGVTAVSYPAGTEVKLAEDGALYSADGKTLYYVPASVENFTIPDTVETIADNAFKGCENLTSVTIPESVTTIGSSAFSGCSSLATVSIPESVTTIGSGVFDGCDNLKDIELPSSITNVEVSEGTTEIASGSFSGLKNLTEVSIPESVTTIGSGAFEGCEKLEEITIPSGVTTIEKNAFAGSGLEEVTFDGTPATIEAGAFPEGVTKLSIKDSNEWCGIEAAEPILGSNGSLYVDGKKVDELTLNPEGKTVGSFAFANTDISKADIKADEIRESAFQGSNIEKVCLNVSTIGKDAFTGCENLTHIYLLSEVPPTADASSFPDNEDMWVYVPTGSLDAYKNTEPWNKFNLIEDTPDNIKAYYDGTLDDPSTGIDNIQVTGSDEKVTFYNLNGIAVGKDIQSMHPGVYVERSSNGIRKIVIR